MKKVKTFGLLGGAAVLLAGILTFMGVAERCRAELAVKADALQAKLESVDTSRTVLWGEATEGEAWADYHAAIALAKGDPRMEVRVRPIERRKTDPEVWEDVLVRHVETLAHLRRGAHRSAAGDPIEWSKGLTSTGVAPDLLQFRALCNLAVMQALAQTERGDHGGGVDVLLDAAQLGRDLMHGGTVIHEMIGGAVVGIATTEVANYDGLLDRLSPDALDRFAAGLRLLDQSIDLGSHSLDGEALLFARTLLRDDAELLSSYGGASRAWRYGFSSRLMITFGALLLMDEAEKFTSAVDEGWEAVRALPERREHHNPILRGLPGKHVLANRYEAVSRIRLLIMAIEHRLGRPVPELEDPFGGVLQHAVEPDGKVRFWSAGRDGADDLFLFRRRT